MSGKKEYVEALDTFAIDFYDLRLLADPYVLNATHFSNDVGTRIQERLALAYRLARQDVPELNLPPLSGDEVLNSSLIQDRYARVKLNAEEYALALSERLKEQRNAFIGKDLTQVGRVRLMQSLAQLVGPTPAILKVVGLDEVQNRAYSQELVETRKKIMALALGDAATFAKVAKEVRRLNEKFFSEEQKKVWHLLTGLEVSSER